MTNLASFILNGSIKMKDHTAKPRENPGSPLAPRTVVWCYVPRQEGDELVPGRTKTPVFVVGVKREGGAVKSIAALYTNIAESNCYNNPAVVRITDPGQKRQMGITEHDRATYLDRLKHIPFETRFFGPEPEISGRVPERLWQVFTARVLALQEERYQRVSLRQSPVTGWSNLPPDEFAPRR